MLKAHFARLDSWPGPRTETREEGQWKASWLQVLDLLEYELGRLDATDIVIQIEDPEGIKGIRNDGSYRMVTQYHFPDKPGVVLTFESPKGSISMPCDRYFDWKNNLRAIGLALKALRAVDRYGVTRGNEQYKGWARLEAPSPEPDREGAIETIASILNAPRDAVAQNPAAFVKEARIRYHPDGVTDEQTKKYRHEMTVLIEKAERVLCPKPPKPAHA